MFTFLFMNFLRKLNSLRNCRFYRKPAYTMNNLAYMKILPEDDGTVHFTFNLNCAEFEINRVFNFSRRKDELISVSLERMKTNVEKEFNKKANKMKKAKKKVTDTAAVETNEVPEVLIKLYDDGPQGNMCEKTFGELISNMASFQKLKFAVMSFEYDIVFNHPWVNVLVLPSSILAGFYVYPSKLELQFAEKSHCDFAWFRGKLSKSNKDEDIEWQQLDCSQFQYLVQFDDIGYKLMVRCVPKNAAKQVGASMEAVSKFAVEAGPGVCPFEHRQAFTRDKCAGREFRVVTYNILADLYCDSDYSRKELFPFCPPYALNIDYRKQLFMKEIVGYNGDIVALQEVDSKIFDLDLEPFLKMLNYEGFFKMKGTTAEGLATFWNAARFDLSDASGINIGENIQQLPIFKSLWLKIQSNPSLVSRVTDRSTAVSTVVLKSKDLKDKYLVVANTHLYFHPDADHVRLLQIGFSMLYIQHIVANTKERFGVGDKDVALIFCGDFNSVPECGIYKLMTEKFVPDDVVDWESNKEEAVRNVTLSQPFNMKSAYGTSLPYTNFTVGFKECIDWIFYETDQLQVTEVIPIPEKEELELNTAIPSPVFPSDHIALVANLKWND